MKTKTLLELEFIIKDANEASIAMRSIGNTQAECKYLDQINDACTELHRRKNARHLYDVYTQAHRLSIHANTRAQAAAYARSAGFEVHSVNMVG